MAQCPKIPALSWCLLQPFELVWLCQSQNEGKFQPGWAGLGTAWEERKVWKVWKVWNVDDVPVSGTGWASRSSKPVWDSVIPWNGGNMEWWEYGMVGIWNGAARAALLDWKLPRLCSPNHNLAIAPSTTGCPWLIHPHPTGSVGEAFPDYFHHVEGVGVGFFGSPAALEGCKPNPP